MAVLNLLVLRAADLERAARFYSALSLVFVRHQHGTGLVHYACESAAGFVFELYPRQERQLSTKATRLGFRVDSIREAVAALVSEGGTILQEPEESPWGLRAVVRDPDGHTVELTEATEKATS